MWGKGSVHSTRVQHSNRHFERSVKNALKYKVGCSQHKCFTQSSHFFCQFEQTMLFKHLYPVVLISGACISVIAKLELRGSFGVGTEAVLFQNGDEVAVLGEAGLNRSFYL